MFPSLVLPQSTKSQVNLNQVSETEISGVRRSYTQELLDFGITFGAQALDTNHQTNPFISPASGNMFLFVFLELFSSDILKHPLFSFELIKDYPLLQLPPAVRLI